jgi:hypothetical protein
MIFDPKDFRAARAAAAVNACIGTIVLLAFTGVSFA